jgi:hypothetical protein
VFVAHEKHVALQVPKEVPKEKKRTLLPILEQAYILQVDVLSVGGKTSSLTIGSSISRTTKPIVAIGVGGKQLPSQSFGRSHLPPSRTSRLKALCCLKSVKVVH